MFNCFFSHIETVGPYEYFGDVYMIGGEFIYCYSVETIIQLTTVCTMDNGDELTGTAIIEIFLN